MKPSADILMKIGADIGVNRRSDLRAQNAWHDEQWNNGHTRLMIMVDLKAVIQSNPARTETSIRWFSHDETVQLGLAPGDFMFLGVNEAGDGRYFIALTEKKALGLASAAQLLRPAVDLRSLADQGVMNRGDLSLIGAARSLGAWHISHRFCGTCGGATEVGDRGWRRVCSGCTVEHFPRMDPVVIMLITFGNECLLARDVRFPETLYSALAGFLEPGEDVEAAVRREVFEEVGLDLVSVDYKFTQPWPFPYSLMIGCRAEAADKALTIDGTEIADAFWVDRSELSDLLNGSRSGSVDLPQDYAIANRLMRNFINEA